MIKICVAGSHGRMGKRIIELARLAQGMETVSSFDIDDDAEQSIAAADVLIDFTSPEASMEHLQTARRLGKAMVIGTTGLSDDQIRAIKEASDDIPVVSSPNMSVGINLLFKLVMDAARVLDAYKVEMSEAHHSHKKDAPSGTAKRLAELIAHEKGVDRSDIQIKSVREGDIVGDHTVSFISDNERVVLSHSAISRDTFASGALEAARFVAEKKKGLYTMRDVLGLE